MTDPETMPTVKAELTAGGVCATNNTGYCNRAALAYGGGVRIARELISQSNEIAATAHGEATPSEEFTASLGPLFMDELSEWRTNLCSACEDCPVNAVVSDIDAILTAEQ